MSAKSKISKQIVTRSLARKQHNKNTQTDSEICVCPSSDNFSPPTATMNEEQKAEFKTLFGEMLKTLQQDMAKESFTQRTQLDTLQTTLTNKANTNAHGVKPDIFDGCPASDASAWLDSFRRIAKLNNWSAELQLNAFPLYLKGVAQAWFLALPDETKASLPSLTQSFTDRFASGPQDWILSQQLSARKYRPGEPLDDYIADITRLTKRLKLSDKECMRYFTEGLPRDLQAYVSLSRPKNFQEAESYARMKDIVNQRQGFSENQLVLNQFQSLFDKFLAKTSDSSKVVASATAATSPTATDKRLDELTKLVKQMQKQQHQQQQQQAASNYAMAAYDQPQQPSRNWQGQPNRQIEQLQRQVSRLQDDLRRYQNPRQSDFRSFGRSIRTTEGDPICTYCQRVGHTWRNCRQRIRRDPRLPTAPPNGQTRPPMGPGSGSPPSQLNE